MAAPDIFDPVTAASFAGNMVIISNNAAAGSQFVAEMSRQSFLRGQEFREAMASMEARQSGQAREILQSQAAMNAPRDTSAAK